MWRISEIPSIYVRTVHTHTHGTPSCPTTTGHVASIRIECAAMCIVQLKKKGEFRVAPEQNSFIFYDFVFCEVHVMAIRTCRYMFTGCRLISLSLSPFVYFFFFCTPGAPRPRSSPSIRNCKIRHRTLSCNCITQRKIYSAIWPSRDRAAST